MHTVCTVPQLPAVYCCMCASHVCLTMEYAIHILKTRLKAISVLRLFGRSPTPTYTRPARQLNASSVLYGSGKVATNAAPHPESCTMIDVHVKASVSNRS